MQAARKSSEFMLSPGTSFDIRSISGIGVLFKGNASVFANVEAMSSMASRARGLLGRSCLPPGSAALLVPCASIHTCFMRFALDVAFLDENLRVLKICRNVRPFRMRWGARGSIATLEWNAGWLPPEKLAVGDCLMWQGKPEA